MRLGAVFLFLATRAACVLQALTAGSSLYGCSVFNPEPFADIRNDAQGNVVFSDTRRMWTYWQQDVDRAVAMEASGQKPGGGFDSWTQHWQRVFRVTRDGRENPQKYVDYVVQKRREHGLPDIDE